MDNKFASIYLFFEQPKSLFARVVHGFLVLCILLSAGIAFLEVEYAKQFKQFSFVLHWIEIVILTTFSVEYLLRFISSPQKWKFFWHPFNLIDLAAIIPFFFGLDVAVLRIFRILRLLKLARHLHLMNIFQFKNTILEKIFPLLFIFSFLKAIIWFLETRHLWIVNDGLGELFAIIGFALGIVLADKISTTQGKYFAIRESFFRIEALLQSMASILPQEKKILKIWGDQVLSLFHNEKSEAVDMFLLNQKLFSVVKQYEKEVGDIAMTAKEMVSEAVFLLQKKSDFVPSAYNVLLQQVILLYLALIVVFMPGAVGMISMIIATYILYGLYHVTLDFDSVSGGEYGLINVETGCFQSFLYILTK